MYRKLLRLFWLGRKAWQVKEAMATLRGAQAVVQQAVEFLEHTHKRALDIKMWGDLNAPWAKEWRVENVQEMYDVADAYAESMGVVDRPPKRI